MSNQLYDVIIIGAGPAGISAGIYAARKKLKTLILSKDLGGQAATAWKVENYPGIKSASGIELMDIFSQHLKEFELEQKFGVEVKKILGQAGNFSLDTSSGQFNTKTIIIATGKTPKKLNIKGEQEFSGKGVVYCATCDAPLFKNKEVAVIGGSNSALQTALALEAFAKKIYLINLNPDFGMLGAQADEFLADKVKASKITEIRHNTETREILGDKFATGLKVFDLKEKQEKIINLQGVFVSIGFDPASKIAEDLVKLNNLKEIEIDNHNMTSCPGIFAAGDVTSILEKQIVIAAGEGAKAALAISSYLTNHK